MVDRKMACLDRGHLPEWWTEEMSVSQEMTAEGETDEGEICKQCQSKFWTEKNVHRLRKMHRMLSR